MNILGIGPLELLLIVVLALIVLGPEKLPAVMAQIGRFIVEFRRMTTQLSDEFNQTLQTELRETRSVVEDTKQSFRDAHASLTEAVSTTPALTRPAPSSAPESALEGGATHSTSQSAMAPVAVPDPTIAASQPPDSQALRNGVDAHAATSSNGTASKVADSRRSADELLPPY
jgi:sec-independent protein translocase protein TatB